VLFVSCFFICFFFFSSRRRHTRFSRDWSSDVCSSDLVCCCVAPAEPAQQVYCMSFGTYTTLVSEAISCQLRCCLSNSAHQNPKPPITSEKKPVPTRSMLWLNRSGWPSALTRRIRQAFMPMVWPPRRQEWL